MRRRPPNRRLPLPSHPPSRRTARAPRSPPDADAAVRRTRPRRRATRRGRAATVLHRRPRRALRRTATTSERTARRRRERQRVEGRRGARTMALPVRRKGAPRAGGHEGPDAPPSEGEVEEVDRPRGATSKGHARAAHRAKRRRVEGRLGRGVERAERGERVERKALRAPRTATRAEEIGLSLERQHLRDGTRYDRRAHARVGLSTAPTRRRRRCAGYLDRREGSSCARHCSHTADGNFRAPCSRSHAST